MTVLDSEPIVPHQFEDAKQQKEAATLGMWVFLATEILFFGAVVVAYAISRWRYPAAFRQGSIDLKWYLGAINTAVLLCSSFTMAMAVHAAALGHNGKVVRNLILTIAFGVIFLGIKGTEYYIEWQEGLIPGRAFTITEPPPSQRAHFLRPFKAFERWTKSMTHTPDEAETRPEQEQLFMIFYFILTGIHATHMVVGISVILVMIVLTRKGKFSAAYHNPIEMLGLYWHFVDIVWVFLFPILYLLRNK